MSTSSNIFLPIKVLLRIVYREFVEGWRMLELAWCPKSRIHRSLSRRLKMGFGRSHIVEIE